MGSHSDPKVQQPIDQDALLAAKLREITARLELDLAGAFADMMGTALPARERCLVYTKTYDLLAANAEIAPLIAEFDRGAVDLVRAGVSEPSVAQSATEVAGCLTQSVTAAGSIQVGGFACSGTSEGAVSAAFADVVFAEKAHWDTPIDFFIVSVVFVVWRPNASDMTTRPDGPLRHGHWEVGDHVPAR